jgi:hypothetical protein
VLEPQERIPPVPYDLFDMSIDEECRCLVRELVNAGEPVWDGSIISHLKARILKV